MADEYGFSAWTDEGDEVVYSSQPFALKKTINLYSMGTSTINVTVPDYASGDIVVCNGADSPYFDHEFSYGLGKFYVDTITINGDTVTFSMKEDSNGVWGTSFSIYIRRD